MKGGVESWVYLKINFLWPLIFSMDPEKPIEDRFSLARSSGRYELPEITEHIVCPVCEKKGVTLTRTMYSLPDGDDVLILLMECDKCNYKKSDMVSMYTAFQPGVYRLNVDDGDFTHKIFRGATGNIEIPEIGMEIERGPAATFEFTNVEGILLKMDKYLAFFLETTPNNLPEWVNAQHSSSKLHACLQKEIPFTLILTDIDGGSYITPSDPGKMEFTEKKKEESSAK